MVSDRVLIDAVVAGVRRSVHVRGHASLHLPPYPRRVRLTSAAPYREQSRWSGPGSWFALLAWLDESSAAELQYGDLLQLEWGYARGQEHHLWVEWAAGQTARTQMLSL